MCAAVLGLVAACTPPAPPPRKPMVERDPQRLFVLEAVPAGGQRVPNLDRRLGAALGRCQTPADVFTQIGRRDAPRGDEDETARRIVAFRPDQILVLEQAGEYRRGTGVVGAGYMLSLYDAATNAELWRGEVAIAQRPREQTTDILVDAIVQRLIEDGILRRCGAPAAAPPRS